MVLSQVLHRLTRDLIPSELTAWTQGSAAFNCPTPTPCHLSPLSGLQSLPNAATTFQTRGRSLRSSLLAKGGEGGSFRKSQGAERGLPASCSHTTVGVSGLAWSAPAEQDG